MAELATRVKLFCPSVPPGAEARLGDVLASGQLAQGPKVAEFEFKFAEHFDVPYAVAMNSGTSALETAYDLIGLGPGDEVITTPLTCTATNLPLLKRGCKLVWADVERDTLCLDPEDVRRKFTERTKAVVLVNLGGLQAHRPIVDAPVVADSCQALGIFNGDYTACSFQAIKHITTGDGGMLVLDNHLEARQAKLLRWFGIDRERKLAEGWEAYKTRMMTCEPELLGGKRHMNDLAAALGIEGLKRHVERQQHRQRLFDIYVHYLADLPGLRVLDGRGLGRQNVAWTCTVLVERRDDFARMLYANGIECNLVQVRNDAYKIFGGRAALPNLDYVEPRYVSLPLGPHVTEGDLEHICHVITGGW